MIQDFELKVDMLTAQLEEAGWDSVKGRAVLLRFMVTFYGFGATQFATWKVPLMLRRKIMGVRTPDHWARVWILLTEFSKEDGLTAYLTK